MLEYSPSGKNIRANFHALDKEHEEALKRAEIAYGEGYQRYVDYNLKHANMSRIEEYWSLSRRSVFLVCIDRATGEIVGTVAVQPSMMCGEQDYYCGQMMKHGKLVDMVGKNPDDAGAEAMNILPSHFYDVDDPTYDPETYVPTDTVILPSDGTVVLNDAQYLIKADDISTATPWTQQNGASQQRKPVPAGYYRRFQPQADFGVPLPQGMTPTTYTDYLTTAALSPCAPIAEDMRNGTYNYFTSLGAAEDLPACPQPHTTYQEAEFRRMSVTAAHRGNGAAQLLVFTVLQTASQVFGFDSLHLSTAQTMDMAVRFYRRMGFREVSTVLEGGTEVPWCISHFKYDFTPRGRDLSVWKYHHCAALQLHFDGQAKKDESSPK